MSELSPATRALLEAAREGIGPDAAAVARMRGKIGAAVGVGAATGGTALGIKLLVVGVVVVGAVAAGLYARGTSKEVPPAASVGLPEDGSSERAAPGPSPERVYGGRFAPPAVAHVAVPAPPPAREVRDIVIDSALIEIEPLPPPAPTPARVTPPPAPRVAPPPAKPAIAAAPEPQVEVAKPAPARIGLAREVELIDRAMAALRRKDHAGALAAVRIHAVETGGSGQLAEDAAAIEIEALCRQRVSVFDKLEAFDARWPTSAQRSRLTNTCR